MTDTPFVARRAFAPSSSRRLVDVIADEAVLDIEAGPGAVRHLRVRPLDDGASAHPFGETVWVVLVGEPDRWEETDELGEEATLLAQQFEGVGGTTYTAALRHPTWTLPAVAVTGVPAARIRHIAKYSTLICWRPNQISIEASGDADDVRRGSFEVTTEHRGTADATTADRPATDAVGQRLAAIASRREGVGPGRCLAYRHRPGMPLELVGRIDLRGQSVPGPGYWRAGIPWLSSRSHVEFQAHSIDDVAWLVDLVATAPVALLNDEQQRLAQIRSRLAAAGAPAWVSPSPTAFHVLYGKSLVAASSVAPRTSYTQTELAQAAFLESAPADVTWLLERLAGGLLPEAVGNRIILERPEAPVGSVDLAFPTDRSLGELEIGRSRGLPDSLRPAQGHVVVAADQWVRFTSGPGFTGDDLAYFAGHPVGIVRGLVLCDAPVAAADLAHVALIPGLRALDLEGTEITDEDLAVLTPLTDLRCLALDRTDISDAGLRHLAHLERLEVLSLGETRVTDAGLAHLAILERLQDLNLFGCVDVRNKGLRHLQALTRLRILNLDATEVTEQGLEPLWSLPDLERIVAYPGAIVCRM